MLTWTQKLRATASQPPLRERVPLCFNNLKIGSVEPIFMHDLAVLANKNKREQLLKYEHLNWHLGANGGDATQCLNELADALHSAHLAGPWRNEQLAVRCDAGVQLGTIERGAVRPLGIATQAVHLLACSPDGRHWVQQRALAKPNDPGKWDTLMGGMVSSGDTLATALARETSEEAGLALDQLQNLAYGGVVAIRQPARDGGGAGYVVEDISWSSCIVPDGVVPVNQDGEVAQFKLMASDDVLAAIQRGEFTTEAALILLEFLQVA